MLETALFLAVLTERLVAGLITPLFDKLSIDHSWLLYVGWAAGGLLSYLAGVNLLGDYFASPIVGQIVTAVLTGGGANLLHDVFDQGG